MPLQFYIDDSGAKGQAGYLVLMGLLHSAEAWAEFSDDWSRCLRADPAIRYFKFNEAVKRRGEFFRWDPARKTQKVLELAEIIDKYRPVALYCALDLQAFQEFVAERAPRFVGKSSATQPYLFAAYYVMRGVCEAAKKSQGQFGRVEMIFDVQEHFKEAARWEYGFIRKHFKEAAEILPPEPWFRDDKDFLPLQAADLVAGAARLSLNKYQLRKGEGFDPPLRLNLPASDSSKRIGRDELEQIGSVLIPMFEAWDAFALGPSAFVRKPMVLPRLAKSLLWLWFNKTFRRR